jgi:cytochrome c2
MTFEELVDGRFVRQGMGHKHKSKRAKRYGPGLGSVVQYGPAAAPADLYREMERRQARSEELRYRIAPDCKVHIQFDGIATQTAIRKLIAYLQMGIEDFPEHAG